MLKKQGGGWAHRAQLVLHPFDGALQQKHEGSFYPWAAAVRMVHTIDLNRLNHRAGISPRVLVDTTGQPVLHIAPSGIEAVAKDAALPWHWYFSRRIAAWEL